MLEGGDTGGIDISGQLFKEGPGNDVIMGHESAHDILKLSPLQSRVSVNLASGTAVGEWNDTLSEIEDVLGTSSDDVIEGDDDRNELNGGGGDDSLYGSDGDDDLYGSSGDDVLFGGPGNDAVQDGPGRDELYGDGGDDVIEGDGADVAIDGGDGINTIAAAAPSEVNLTTSTIVTHGSAVTLGGFFQHIVGSTGDDVLIGNDLPNEIGLAFSRFGSGSGGLDVVRGEGGNDEIYAPAGQAVGGTGDDVITASTVEGEDGNDSIFGSFGDDVLSGGDGDDSIHGDYGNDFLDGGPGVDDLHGGDGEDECIDGETYDSCEEVGAAAAAWRAASRPLR